MKNNSKELTFVEATAGAATFFDAGFLVVAALEEGLADAFDAGFALVVAALGLAFAAAGFVLAVDAWERGDLNQADTVEKDWTALPSLLVLSSPSLPSLRRAF
jgi:hypothetical protein